ncbi:MAG: 7-carboxy-7-deazaguanine synthase QueE [Verrucomicrobiales bacterium]
MRLARMPDGSPEIFHTLQGEGRSTGRPSVFLRASLCNLHCRWCDTDYTWNWEGTPFAHEKDGEPDYRKFRREEQIVEADTAAIVKRVLRYPASNYVFTGGEPLLQEKAWVALMDALAARRRDARFEIETNGTLFPGAAFLERIHRCNVSPKLANSGVDAALRFKPEVLRQFAETEKADFKFVVGNEADISEILALAEAIPLPAGRVFLMPKARTVAELEACQGRAAQLALDHGFNYSDRLHLRLFGATRGT